MVRKRGEQLGLRCPKTGRSVPTGCSPGTRHKLMVEDPSSGWKVHAARCRHRVGLRCPITGRGMTTSCSPGTRLDLMMDGDPGGDSVERAPQGTKWLGLRCPVTGRKVTASCSPGTRLHWMLGGLQCPVTGRRMMASCTLEMRLGMMLRGDPRGNLVEEAPPGKAWLGGVKMKWVERAVIS